MPARLAVELAAEQRRLADEEVRVARRSDERVARAGVAGVRHRPVAVETRSAYASSR